MEDTTTHVRPKTGREILAEVRELRACYEDLSLAAAVAVVKYGVQVEKAEEFVETRDRALEDPDMTALQIYVHRDRIEELGTRVVELMRERDEYRAVRDLARSDVFRLRPRVEELESERDFLKAEAERAAEEITSWKLQCYGQTTRISDLERMLRDLLAMHDAKVFVKEPWDTAFDEVRAALWVS
jgi:chromosome segregation ATPase